MTDIDKLITSARHYGNSGNSNYYISYYEKQEEQVPVSFFMPGSWKGEVS